MANESDAAGSIEVSDLTGLTNHEFWDALDVVQNGWYYDFQMDEGDERDEECVSFYGTGRWTFMSNIDNLPNWLADPCKNPEVADRVKTAQDALTRAGWELTFEFHDIECGNGVLYDAVMTVTHAAGTPLDKSVAEEVSDCDHQYCVAGLVEYAEMDVEEAFEYAGWENGESDQDDLESLLLECKGSDASWRALDDVAQYASSIADAENWVAFDLAYCRELVGLCDD